MLLTVEHGIALRFGGKKLLIETDIPEIARFVRKTHGLFRDDSPSKPDAILSAHLVDDGFVFDGATFHGSPESLFDLIQLRIGSTFVELRPDLLWIHAGVVACPSGAMIIAAPSGNGKSTLASLLCERGWKFMSDEFAPIDTTCETVLPFPRQLVRRVAAAMPVSQDKIAELAREQVDIPKSIVVTSPVTIHAIVFPTFIFGMQSSTQAVTAGDTAVQLLSNCFQFPDDKRAGLDAVGAISNRMKGLKIHFADSIDAANVLHNLYWQNNEPART